jgi:hypothetical protein
LWIRPPPPSARNRINKQLTCRAVIASTTAAEENPYGLVAAKRFYFVV